MSGMAKRLLVYIGVAIGIAASAYAVTSMLTEDGERAEAPVSAAPRKDVAPTPAPQSGERAAGAQPTAAPGGRAV